jgi:hypothetical protein
MRSAALGLTALVAVRLAPPTAVAHQSPRARVTPFSVGPKQWLQERDLRYDPTHAMVETLDGTSWRRLPRESVWYATTLRRSPDARDRSEAFRVLRAVLASQVTDPSSPFDGLWPVVLETPVAQQAVPDLNWAEFVSVALLDAVEVAPGVPPSLADSVTDASLRAVHLMTRRGPDVVSFNILAMQVSAMLRVAVARPAAGVTEAARTRLDRVHTLLVIRRQWDEYNSPTYSPVALHALLSARVAASLLRGRSPAQLSSALSVLCNKLLSRYADGIGELAGPQSRAYPVMLAAWNRRDLVSMLEGPSACGGVPLPTPRLVLDTLIPARSEVVDHVYLGGRLPVVGSTLIAPRLSFGSASVSAFWSQHRPVLVFVGDSLRKGYVRLRVLRDDVDFAGAQWFAAQQPDAMLGAVLFATDGGLDHPDHRIDPRAVPLHRLRIRFEFGGALRPDNIVSPDGRGMVDVMVGGTRFVLGVPFAALDDLLGHWEHGRLGDGGDYLDLVLVHSRSTIDLTRSAPAGVVVAFGVASSLAAEPVLRITGDTLRAGWRGMRLAIPLRPLMLDSMHRAVASLSPQ